MPPPPTLAPTEALIAWRLQRWLMTLISTGAPLAAVIEAIVQSVEETQPAMRCAISLVDKDGRCVDAPDAGVPASWSLPIVSTAGKVLGSFAIYFISVRRPSAAEAEFVRQFADLASIAIEKSVAAEALRESEARFRGLSQLGAGWYWEQDEQFRFTEISQGVLDRAGIPPTASLGKTRWELDPEGAYSRPMQLHRELLERHQPFRDFEIERADVHGRMRTICTSGEPIFDAACQFRGYRGVASDVTERKRLEAELETLATTDALTGFANRGHFFERLEQERARVARARNHVVAVVVIDIDHFKRINDALGHAAGDAVIRHCAAVLRNALRATDVAGRLGGDEFAVVMPGATTAAAVALAERLRADLLQCPMLDDGHTIAVAISAGVAVVAANDIRVDDVLKRADAALHRAKQRGRNCVEAYQPANPGGGVTSIGGRRSEGD